MTRSAPRARSTRDTVRVLCWSGYERIDREIAPIIKAWNALDWLIPLESCSGHGREAVYIVALVRLTELPRLVGYVRTLHAALGEPWIELTLEHDRRMMDSLWTEGWGAVTLRIVGSEKGGSLSADEIDGFVRVSVDPEAAAQGQLTKLTDVTEPMLIAMGLTSPPARSQSPAPSPARPSPRSAARSAPRTPARSPRAR